MAKCSHLGVCVLLAAAALYGSSTAQPPARRVTTVRPDARTGRLVRGAAIAPRPKAPARPAEPAPTTASFNEAVERIAYRHALPVQLIHSVIKVESNYNPNAVSPKGAMGLMQLIPATARRFGVGDAFDPIENMQGGARYLRYLLDLYGNYPLALAAYNAGEGAVARYGGVPPYPETRNYLALVKRALDEAKKNETPAPAPAAATGEPGETYNRIEEVVDPDGRVRYVSR